MKFETFLEIFPLNYLIIYIVGINVIRFFSYANR